MKNAVANIGVVVVAHGDLAEAMVNTAQSLLASEDDQSTRSLAHCGVALTSSKDDSLELLSNTIKELDQGAGVLVLADLFGGSAANLALSQLGEGVEVVTGVNLAMVIDAIHHRSESLGALANHVAHAATESVIVANKLLKNAA